VSGQKLSKREREVEKLLLVGRSLKEVGVELGITTKTAEVHRSNLYRKREVHSRAQLAREAVLRGEEFLFCDQIPTMLGLA